MQKCKITVLKREFYPDLAKEYIPFPDFGPCEMMKSLYFETLLCRRKRNGTGDAEQVRNDALASFSGGMSCPIWTGREQ